MKYLLGLIFLLTCANSLSAELPDCLKYGPYFCTRTMRDKIEMMNRGGATIPQELLDYKDKTMPGEKTTYIERIAPPLYGQSNDEDPESRFGGRSDEMRAGLKEYLRLKEAMNQNMTATGLTEDDTMAVMGEDFDVSAQCTTAECKYFAENPRARENLFIYDRGNPIPEDIPKVHDAERLEMMKWMNPLMGTAALLSASGDIDVDVSISAGAIWDALQGDYDDALEEVFEDVSDSVKENVDELTSGPGLYLAGQRQDQPFAHFSYCGIPEIVGVCTHLSQYNIPYVSWLCELDSNKGEDNEIYWGYRVPFQKIETVRNPFATAYFTRDMMNAMLPISKAVYSSMISPQLKSQFSVLKERKFFVSLFKQSVCVPEKLDESKCNAELEKFFKEAESVQNLLPFNNINDAYYQGRYCIPKSPVVPQEGAEEGEGNGEGASKPKAKEATASGAGLEDLECLERYNEINEEMRGELSFYATPQPTNTSGIYNVRDELTKMYNLVTVTYPSHIFPSEWKDNEYDNVAFIEALQDDPKQFFFRDPNKKNTINVEFRVINSGFHEVYKDSDDFKGFETYGNWSVPYSWLHCGAPLSACKEKPEVGVWYSEFPPNILADKFREPNYAFYGEEMFGPGSNATCRSGHYARGPKAEAIAVLQGYGIKEPGSTVGKKVPIDILAPCFADTPEEKAKCDLDLVQQKEKFDADDAHGKCIPHTSLGEKFDALSQAKAKYTYEAAVIGLYRGLRDALQKGAAHGQFFHDVQWEEEGAPMTTSFRPRDFIQLMGQAGRKFPGCYATKPPDHPWVIPLHHGATYETRPEENDQIQQDWDEKINERYTFAHWRYLQACPPSDVSIFGVDVTLDHGCYIPVNVWAQGGLLDGKPYILK